MIRESVFKYLSESPDIPAQQIQIIDVGERRLASVSLRASPVWKWAATDSRESTIWSQLWNRAASAEDLEDLKEHGRTPKFDLRDGLSQELKLLVTSSISSSSRGSSSQTDWVVPIGRLSNANIIRELLSQYLNPRQLDTAHPDLALPIDLHTLPLQAEIAHWFPPTVKQDLFLRTVKVNWNKSPAQLELDRALLVKSGRRPPSGALFTPNVNALHLCRVIPADKAHGAPVYFVVMNANQEPLQAWRADPPRNVFTLGWWLNYKDDQLGLRVVDDQSSQSLPLTVIPIAEVKTVEQLPEIKLERSLDILFIIDGTMRKKGTRQPDIEEAKQFVIKLLQQLSQETSMDVRCGLALYGDRRDVAGSSYTIRIATPRGLETASDLERSLRLDYNITATDDRDYEALLEVALQWANLANPTCTAGWRKNTAKWVIVIGYAPPHPPDSVNPYENYAFPYGQYGFFHEPWTSPIDWQAEIQQMRKKGINLVGIWTPYADLDDRHRCMRYSREVWLEIGNGGRNFFQGLDESHIASLLTGIREGFKPQYLPDKPIVLPLIKQEPDLRNI
ncbi:MAG: hypothetical protein WCF84_14060 [Anaerolineae bacterium]